MMRFFFIANRFLNSNKGTGKLTGMVSTLGIAIGCFALIISVSVLNGFKSQVNNKIKDFEGDIKISSVGLSDDVSIFDGFFILISKAFTWFLLANSFVPIFFGMNTNLLS